MLSATKSGWDPHDSSDMDEIGERSLAEWYALQPTHPLAITLPVAIALCRQAHVLFQQAETGLVLTPNTITITQQDGAWQIGIMSSTAPQSPEAQSVYQAPEIQRGQPSTPAAGMFNLGAVLFYLFSGQIYLPTDTNVSVWATQSDPARSLRSVSRHVPEELSHLIERLLAKLPEHRPTITDVIQTLEKLLDAHYTAAAAPLTRTFKAEETATAKWFWWSTVKIPAVEWLQQNQILSNGSSSLDDDDFDDYGEYKDDDDWDDIIDHFFTEDAPYDCYLYGTGGSNFEIYFAADSDRTKNTALLSQLKTTPLLKCSYNDDHANIRVHELTTGKAGRAYGNPHAFPVTLRFHSSDRRSTPLPSALLDKIRTFSKRSTADPEVKNQLAWWGDYITAWGKLTDRKKYQVDFTACRLDTAEDGLTEQLRFVLSADAVTEELRKKIDKSKGDQIELIPLASNHAQPENGSTEMERRGSQPRGETIGEIIKFTAQKLELIVAPTDDFIKKYRDPATNHFIPPPGGTLRYTAHGEAQQIERQQKAVENLKRGEAANPQLMQFLFNVGQARLPAAEAITLRRDELLNPNLNTEQLNAVEGALNAPDLFLIWGPPGTGKTTVIAELCYQFARRGERVLLASQAHLAVDNAISKLQHDSRIFALRLGSADKIEEEGQQFIETNAVHTLFTRTGEAAAGQFNKIEQALRQHQHLLTEVLPHLETGYLPLLADTERRQRLEENAHSAANQATHAAEHLHALEDRIRACAVLDDALAHHQPLDQIGTAVLHDTATYQNLLTDLQSATQFIAQLNPNNDLFAEQQTALQRRDPVLWQRLLNSSDADSNAADQPSVLLHYSVYVHAAITALLDRLTKHDQQFATALHALDEAERLEQRSAGINTIVARREQLDRLYALRHDLQKCRTALHSTPLSTQQPSDLSSAISELRDKIRQWQPRDWTALPAAEWSRVHEEYRGQPLPAVSAKDASHYARAFKQISDNAADAIAHYENRLGNHVSAADPTDRTFSQKLVNHLHLSSYPQTLNLWTMQRPDRVEADLTELLETRIRELDALAHCPLRWISHKKWTVFATELQVLKNFTQFAANQHSQWQYLTEQLIIRALRKEAAAVAQQLRSGASADHPLSAKLAQQLQTIDAWLDLAGVQDYLTGILNKLDHAAPAGSQPNTTHPLLEQALGLVSSYMNTAEVSASIALRGALRRLIDSGAAENTLPEAETALKHELDQRERAYDQDMHGLDARNPEQIQAQCERWQDEARQLKLAQQNTLMQLRHQLGKLIGCADLKIGGNAANLEAWRQSHQQLMKVLERLTAWHTALEPTALTARLQGDLRTSRQMLSQRYAEQSALCSQLQAEADRAASELAELNGYQQQWAAWWEQIFAGLPKKLRDYVPVGGDPHACTVIEALVNHLRAEAATNQTTQRLQQLPALRSYLDDWQRRLHNPSPRDTRDLTELYVKCANVIGVTCGQVQQAIKAQPQYAAVIIDEVSKATPPELLLAMLHGSRIILVGDHKQLPPLLDDQTLDEVEADPDSPVREGLKKPYFADLYNHAPAALKQMLTEQYRMRPSIMSAINQFYDNSLRGGHDRRHGFNVRSAPADKALVWVDLAQNSANAEKKEGTSFYNAAEIAQIQTVLTELNADWHNKHGISGPKPVGIITFYGSQERHLKKALPAIDFPALDLRFGTVDRFQGMERPVIIVSLVRNNADDKIGFAKASERINVAFSRAQELLIIVGSRKLFCKTGTGAATQIYRRIDKIVRKEGAVIHVD